LDVKSDSKGFIELVEKFVGIVIVCFEVKWKSNL
jgi:hypothetical protein